MSIIITMISSVSESIRKDYCQLLENLIGLNQEQLTLGRWM